MAFFLLILLSMTVPNLKPIDESNINLECTQGIATCPNY